VYARIIRDGFVVIAARARFQDTRRLNKGTPGSQCRLFNALCTQNKPHLSQASVIRELPADRSASSPRLWVKCYHCIARHKEIPGRKAFPCIPPRQQRQRHASLATGNRATKCGECGDFQASVGGESAEPADAFITFNRLSISVELQFSTRTMARGGWREGGGVMKKQGCCRIGFARGEK
jgi:hypothetical protein